MALRTWFLRSLILALLAGVGYAVWHMQSYVSPDAVKAAVASTFADQFPDTDISVGSARMRVFGGISVRDLTLRRKADGQPFFVAPAAVIYHDKEQVNRGKLVIRKIELTGPTLRLERTATGWTLDGLTKPGPADAPLPTFVVSGATVTMTDRRPDGLPPVTLTDASFTLLNDPAPVHLNLNGSATATVGEVPVRVTLAARLNRRTGQMAGRVEVPELPLGPGVAALVGRAVPELAGKLSALTGRLGLRAEFVQDGNTQPRFDAHLTLKDGRFTDPALPAPVERIEAAVRFVDGKLIVEKATASLGPLSIAANLETRPLPAVVPAGDDLFAFETLLEKAELAVKGIEFNDALFAALPKDAGRAREMFQPIGGGAVVYRFARSNPNWRREIRFTPDRLGLTYEKFRYPLTDVAGSVVYMAAADAEGETRLDLTGTAGGQRVTVAGTVAGAGPDPKIDLTISGTNLPIDDTLFDALPGPKYPAALRRLRAAGRGEFTAIIRQKLGVNLTENTFRITVYDGSVCHEQFPYPLERVAGQVIVSVSATDPTRPLRPGEPLVELPDTDTVELRNFTARHGLGLVWLKGDNLPVPGTHDRRLNLSVWGKDCPADDHLRRAVSELKLDSLWRTFSPRGNLTFNVDLEITDRMAALPPCRRSVPRPGPVQPPRTAPPLGTLVAKAKNLPINPPTEVPFDPTTDLKLAVNFEGPSVTPDFFPYDLDGLSGQVRYEASRVRLEHLRAVHGPSKWALDAGEVRFCADGRVWANLGKLDVTPLVADEPFLNALPGSLQKAARSLNLKGPAELSMKHVVVLTPPDGPPAALPDLPMVPAVPGQAARVAGPNYVARGQTPVSATPTPADPDVFWQGELKLAGAAFDAGVECQQVVGRFATSGRHHGTHLGRVVGNLWVESARIADMPMTSVQAAFDADPQAIDPNKAGTFQPPAVKVTDLGGKLFGGTVGGTARVVLADPTRYTLDLHAAGVRLEEVARHQNLGNGAKLDGEANAHLALTSAPDATGKQRLEGGGTVDVDRGHLLNLPALVPLLKTLKFQAPDKAAFEEAHASFTVLGDRVRVDNLDLLGTAVSFGGSGETDIRGEFVRFDVYPIWSQTVQRLLTTPFGDLSAALSENLFKVEVSRAADGKLKYEPRVVPGLTDPMRRLAERVRAKVRPTAGATYRAAPR